MAKMSVIVCDREELGEGGGVAKVSAMVCDGSFLRCRPM